MPTPQRGVGATLECGSLLPLFHQSACWLGIVHAFEILPASSRDGKRQQAAALQSFAPHARTTGGTPPFQTRGEKYRLEDSF
jgi:hypothetical protein